ncbi:Hypothetical protein CINCED_3A005727 [Cinara cedri]|uniref:Uncharacterized protein n=1 Tax=Cinara cedri TaxID=506608 RepID=A0A5E4NSK9_9HEMI|nr:Hypothetical protein CINCED_3A005727 [Cinara cedri]
MNATGCVTALGDGGEAFVVLLADDHCYRGRGSRPEEMAMSLPCPAGRPPVPRPPMTTAEAYKSRPRRKDRGAFVVLPEPPPLVTAQTNSTAKSSAATGSDCSGRVSPFRGHGFKTPEHGRSRASTPPSSSSSSFKHLRRQLSEPRITAGRRQRPVVANQRLSVSTKDLSMAVDKSSLPRNNNSSPRIPNKQLGLPKLLPAEKSGATATGRQPAVLNRQTNVSTNKTANVSRSAVANRHPPPPIKSSPRLPKKQSKVSAVEVTKKSKANSLPQPPIKSSPSSSKKQSTVATAEVTTSKTNSLPASKGDARLSDNNPQAAVTIPIASESLISVAAVPKTTVSTSVAVSTLMTAFTTTNEPTSTTMTVPTTMVAASTSATAIAATHVTNAAALPVVKSDGPIVTAAPPPAAIAVNTLATMSFVNSSNASKPPPSATRFRELPSVTDQPAHSTATVVVVDGGMSADTTTIQQPAHINVMTTTPPLSYELEEIVVEPETENQSGRSNGISRLQASGDEGVQNNNIVLSTSNSSNGGHKTVAWAR